MENEAGIRELKRRLSAYMRRVKAGETIVITEYGKPVARLVPIRESLIEEVETLVQSGIVAWSGQQLAKRAPIASVRGGKGVAELLLEDRD